MNIMHLKYAVEVARTGSINKAAENLIMGQPNLSRAIKKLEASLGITIFDRSAKGMLVTPEGAEFLRHAAKILQQIDQLEAVYQTESAPRQSFSLSAPHVGYIADAFVSFSRRIDSQHPAELLYQEAGARETIQKLLQTEFSLGIVRCAEEHGQALRSLLEEKQLACEPIAQFQCVLLMSRQHPLAAKESIRPADLLPFVEICHKDPFVPTPSLTGDVPETLPQPSRRRIVALERAGQFELLSENAETFLWSAPVSAKALRRYQLVQRDCPDCPKRYQDVLIYSKNRQLSDLEHAFLAELQKSRVETFQK